MIKASGTMNGRPLLVLGLSRANCERLLNRKPIHFDTAQLPELPLISVIIVAGETETDMSAEMFAQFPTMAEVRPDGDEH